MSPRLLGSKRFFSSLALQYYAGHVGSGAGGDLVQDDNRNNGKHFFFYFLT